MAVVLTLVFLCTSGLYTRQLTRERYNLASTTLTKVNTDFQLEMNRLDSLLTLCLQDSSLVFSISDRLDTSFFLDNAEDAASRLSLIRQSLPYAKLVYLYTHNSDKVVRDNGSLYKGKDFSRIVLDKTVESMTTFKQIIGRGTRIREKEGKTHFVVMDFRNVTRLFSDPDWDGPVEQVEGFQHGSGGNKPKGGEPGGIGEERPLTPLKRLSLIKTGAV